jgi:GGDEF domain-containing protein
MTENSPHPIAHLINIEWLRACPAGILVLRGQSVLWANAALKRMARISLRTLTDPAQLTHPTVQKLIHAEGLVTLAIAPGTQAWFFCERAEFPDNETGKTLTVAYFQDIGNEIRAAEKRDELARQVENLSLVDALTGLANHSALVHALNVQVSRSRRYYNPLTLVLIRIEPPTHSELPDGTVLAIARFLRDRLRWVDELGRHSVNTFMMILPETDEAGARILLGKIRVELDELLPRSAENSPSSILRIGIMQWNRGMDAAALVAATEMAMTSIWEEEP